MMQTDSILDAVGGRQRAYAPGAAADRAFAATNRAAHCAGTVLFVGADPEDAQVLRQRIEDTCGAAFQLQFAPDTAMALQRLSAGDIGLVLLRVAASSADDFGALERLRGAARRVPIIALVDSDDPDLAAEAAGRGAQDCLVQGEITGKSLVRAIRGAIERQRHTENERRDREALELALQGMTEGLILVDASMQVLYCNSVIERIVGCRNDDALARLRRLIEDAEVSPRDRDALENALRGVSAGPVVLDMTIRQPAAEITLSTFPITLESGQALTGILMRDVTRQRDMERRHDSFVSVASHELRTPMATIVGYSELILTREPPAKTRQLWLERILTDARRLSALVDDMLNVSRIHSGKVRIKAQPLALGPILNDVLGSLGQTTAQHNLLANVPADLPQILGDREKVHQVLVNLVGNAIKYSPDGGTVTVTAACDSDRKRVTVDVQDEGIGIAPKDLEQLFRSFGRIRRPETEEIRGTGLGLYIVKELLGLMSGDITVESEMGRGSTFRFSLPAAELQTLEDARP